MQSTNAGNKMNESNLNLVIEKENLIQRAYELKKLIEEKNNELKTCYSLIVKDMAFEAGKRTKFFTSGAIKLKANLPIKTQWNQKELKAIRKHFDDKTFFQLFDWELKPKAANINRFLKTEATEDEKSLLEGAREFVEQNISFHFLLNK